MTGTQNTRAWWIARAIGGLLLAAYVLKVLSLRMANAWHPFSCEGDQNQGAWEFWRYHVDGALPPGQLLTDYAYAYHAPPAYWAFMATLSTFVEPLTAAKVGNVLAWTLLTAAVVVVVGKRSEWLLGIAAGFIVIRSPDLARVFSTGLARSWGPFLVLLFLGAFMARRHYACLAILVLQAAFYPPTAIPCALAYGTYCVIAGPMAERVRRCKGMFVAGLLIIGFAEFQNLKSPAWWGPLVTVEEAAKMPAWGLGGRFHEVPLHPAVPNLLGNYARGYLPQGDALAPAALQAFATAHEWLLVAAPALLASLAIGAARVRRRRLGNNAPSPNGDDAFPWEIPALFAAASVGYLIARSVAFKMFLPQRQLTYVIPFVVQVGLPLIAWYGARALTGNRRALNTAIAIAISVLPTFLILGDGLKPGSLYKDHGSDTPLWMAIRKLPFDATIACDNYVCDTMGMFGYHAAWSNRTLTHPFRKGYYDEAERRLVEQSRALFATSWQELTELLEREKIDYLVYNLSKTQVTEKNMYQPAKQKIEAVFLAAKQRGAPVLADPPDEICVFRFNSFRIVDTVKLRAWVNAGAQRPQPFIGPLPER